MTVDQLEAAYTDRTKAVLFVSPDNPSGSVYTPAETKAIGEWALERGVWVITDEIYEHLTYGPHEFSSMPVLVPDIAEQCLILNGVAKTYAMTGWRVGWLIGPNDVVKAATNFQSHATSNVNNVAQRATIAALNGGLDDVAMMRAAFDRRGTTMHRMLSDIDGVKCMEPQGAFYCFPNVSGLLDRDARRHGRPHHARARRSRARDDRRWHSCQARRSAPLVTRGSRSRSATTISSRASAASPSSPPADHAPMPTTGARVRMHDPDPRCARTYVTRQSSSV